MDTQQFKHLNLPPEDQLRRSRLISAFYRNQYQSMSRAEIAEKAGYSPEYISRLFSGERRISDEAAKVLSPILGIREDYLLGKDTYMTEEDYRNSVRIADSVWSNFGLINRHCEFCIYEVDKIPDELPGFKKEDIDYIRENVSDATRIVIDMTKKTGTPISDSEYKDIMAEIADYADYRLKIFTRDKREHHMYY